MVALIVYLIAVVTRLLILAFLIIFSEGVTHFASVNFEARNKFVAPENSLRDRLVSSDFRTLLALRSRLDSRHALGVRLHYGPGLE